jgi:hypothetical protein
MNQKPFRSYPASSKSHNQGLGLCNRGSCPGQAGQFPRSWDIACQYKKVVILSFAGFLKAVQLRPLFPATLWYLLKETLLLFPAIIVVP